MHENKGQVETNIVLAFDCYLKARAELPEEDHQEIWNELKNHIDTFEESLASIKHRV
jgi:hypothetical protein